jgi:hypothetical protein
VTQYFKDEGILARRRSDWGEDVFVNKSEGWKPNKGSIVNLSTGATPITEDEAQRLFPEAFPTAGDPT